MRKLVSVSVTPWARAASRLRRISASRSVMSALSKWVTCGITVADSVIRSAIVRRRCESGWRSIGPHCSKLGSGGACRPTVASGFAGPRSTAGRAGSWRSGAAGARGATAAGLVAPATAARTSSSVTRPPDPLPETARRSTPSSRASRRVAGVAGTGPSVTRAAGGGVARAPAAGVAWRARPSVGAVFVPGVADASPNETRTCPTFTVWPACTWILSTRPLIGDGISTCALSVSTSSRGASSRMSSPSWTSTLTISASVSPSPRSGSRKSRAIAVIVPAPARDRRARRSGRTATASRRRRRARARRERDGSPPRATAARLPISRTRSPHVASPCAPGRRRFARGGAVAVGIGGTERVDHAGAAEDAEPGRGLAGVEIAHDDGRAVGRPGLHDVDDALELTVGARRVRRDDADAAPRGVDLRLQHDPRVEKLHAARQIRHLIPRDRKPAQHRGALAEVHHPGGEAAEHRQYARRGRREHVVKAEVGGDPCGHVAAAPPGGRFLERNDVGIERAELTQDEGEALFQAAVVAPEP